MRVLTWNLWWRFGPWRERQPAILAELRTVDADIVLLQEVWAADGVDQVEELAAGTGRYAVRTTTPGGEPQPFGNAVLSRWPVEVIDQLDLPGLDGGRGNRSALACSVHAPGGPLVVVVTHLSWQYDRSALRQRQLASIIALVDAHRDPDPDGAPVVFGGDLNAVPESDEIRRLTGLAPPYVEGMILTDCWAAVGDGPGHTWTRDNPNALDALLPRRRLDYLFVTWPRGKPFLNPRSARLIGTDEHGGVVPSDHYGVLVELDDRAGSVEA